MVLSCEFCKILKNIYFANFRKDLPLNSKIFTRIFLSNVLGFYHKRIKIV